MGRCEGRVDIETEWNLKQYRVSYKGHMVSVDIETEWNLKNNFRRYLIELFCVDIETEWNLKVILLKTSAKLSL